MLPDARTPRDPSLPLRSAPNPKLVKKIDRARRRRSGMGRLPRIAMIGAAVLLIGTGIAADFDLNAAFWAKMEKIMQRESRMVNGKIRVSEFRD